MNKNIFTRIVFSAALALTGLSAFAEPVDLTRFNYAHDIYTWIAADINGSGNIVSLAAQNTDVVIQKSTGSILQGNSHTYNLPPTNTSGNFFEYICATKSACVAPGSVLRFNDTSYNGANIAKRCGGDFTPLTLGGIIVEEGAVGYKLEYTGNRANILGSINGSSTLFVFNEDFAIIRNGYFDFFSGDVTLEIADGKVFDFNSVQNGITEKKLQRIRGTVTGSFGGGTPTSTDGGTLHIVGGGTLKVYTLDASSATLDVSTQPASAAGALNTAKIDGILKLNETTILKLPAAQPAGVAYKLASSITGLESGDHSMMVGLGTESAKTVMLTVDAANGTVSWAAADTCMATISANSNWTNLNWSPAWANGKVAELTVSGNRTLTVNSEITVNPLVITGNGNLTLAKSGTGSLAGPIDISHHTGILTVKAPFTLNGTITGSAINVDMSGVNSEGEVFSSEGGATLNITGVKSGWGTKTVGNKIYAYQLDELGNTPFFWLKFDGDSFNYGTGTDVWTINSGSYVATDKGQGFQFGESKVEGSITHSSGATINNATVFVRFKLGSEMTGDKIIWGIGGKLVTGIALTVNGSELSLRPYGTDLQAKVLTYDLAQRQDYSVSAYYTVAISLLDNNVRNMYVNGELVATGSSSSNNKFGNQVSALGAGGNGPVAVPTGLVVDDWRFYKATFSEVEIRQLSGISMQNYSGTINGNSTDFSDVTWSGATLPSGGESDALISLNCNTVASTLNITKRTNFAEMQILGSKDLTISLTGEGAISGDINSSASTGKVKLVTPMTIAGSLIGNFVIDCANMTAESNILTANSLAAATFTFENVAEGYYAYVSGNTVKITEAPHELYYGHAFNDSLTKEPNAIYNIESNTSVSYVNGILDKALDMSSVSGYYSGGTIYMPREWTLYLIAKTSTRNGDNIIAFGQQYNSAVGKIGFFAVDGGVAAYTWGNGNNARRLLTGPATNATTEYHKYAFVYRNGKLHVNVDGVTIGEEVEFTAASSILCWQVGGVHGGMPTGGDITLRTSSGGALDEFRLYSGAMSDAQIAALNAEFSVSERTASLNNESKKWSELEWNEPWPADASNVEATINISGTSTLNLNGAITAASLKLNVAEGSQLTITKTEGVSLTVGRAINIVNAGTITFNTSITADFMFSGNGNIYIPEGVTLSVMQFPGCAVHGAGTLEIVGASANGNTNIASLQNAELWTGLVRLANVNIESIHLNNFGNTSSKIELNHVVGYLSAESGYEIPIEVILTDRNGAAALEINNGFSGAWTIFKKISGDGTILIPSNSATTSASIVIENAEGFTGAVRNEVASGGSQAIVFGKKTDFANVNLARKIGVSTTVTWGRNSKATDGFVIKEPGELTINEAEINGKITGNGKIVFTANSTIAGSQTEGLSSAAVWQGTVKRIGKQLTNTDLNGWGNSASTIEFDGCIGSIWNNNYEMKIALSGRGLELNAGSAGTLAFGALSGDGALKLTAANNLEVRVPSMPDYTGEVSVRNGASLSVGASAVRSAAAAINVGSDVTVPTGCGWSANTLTVGDNVNLNGESGSVFVTLEAENPEFSETQVSIDNVFEYKLKLFGSEVKVVLTASRISVNFESIQPGTDFRSLVLRGRAIVSYPDGATESSVVRFQLLNGAGEVVGETHVTEAFGRELDFNMTIDDVDPGADYRIVADILLSGETHGRGETTVSAFSGLSHDGWIYEDADTYNLRDGHDVGTGTWTFTQGVEMPYTESVHGLGNSIAFYIEENGYASYTPLNKARYNSLREFNFELRSSSIAFTVDEGESTTWTPDAAVGCVAGVTIAAVRDANGDIRKVFAFWDGTNWHISDFAAEIDTRYLFKIRLDYRNRFVNYYLDEDDVLKHLISLAPAVSMTDTESVNCGSEIRITGDGHLRTMTGELADAHLAKVGESVEYKTVAEAIAAVGDKDLPIELLWDASLELTGESGTFRIAAADVSKLAITQPLGYHLERNSIDDYVQYSFYLSNNWIDWGEASGLTINGDSYTVLNAAGLAWLAAKSWDEIGLSGSVTLNDDIDLSGRDWTPILNFSGSFAGVNHQIDGLRSGDVTGLDEYGLFANAQNASFENVVFNDVAIGNDAAAVADNVGALVGRASGTVSIKNVQVAGGVISSRGTRIAGVAGLIDGGNVKLTDNSNSAEIIAAAAEDNSKGYFVSGIAVLGADAYASLSIKNNDNSGSLKTIVRSNIKDGGNVAQIAAGSKLSSEYNTIDISGNTGLDMPFAVGGAELQPASTLIKKVPLVNLAETICRTGENGFGRCLEANDAATLVIDPVLKRAIMSVAVYPNGTPNPAGEIMDIINASAAGSTIVIPANIVIHSTIVIDRDVTLDFNGHIIEMAFDGYALEVADGCAVSLQSGNGNGVLMAKDNYFVNGALATKTNVDFTAWPVEDYWDLEYAFTVDSIPVAYAAEAMSALHDGAEIIIVGETEFGLDVEKSVLTIGGVPLKTFPDYYSFTPNATQTGYRIQLNERATPRIEAIAVGDSLAIANARIGLEYAIERCEQLGGEWQTEGGWHRVGIDGETLNLPLSASGSSGFFRVLARERE